MLTRESYRLLGPQSVSGDTTPGVGRIRVLCTTPAPDSTLPSLALYMYANSRNTHCKLHDKSPVREVLCLMTTVTTDAAGTDPLPPGGCISGNLGWTRPARSILQGRAPRIRRIPC